MNQAGQRRSTCIDHADNVVLGVRDIEVSIAVYRKAMRIVELRRCGRATIAGVVAGVAQRHARNRVQEARRGVHHAHRLTAVRDIDISRRIHRDALRVGQPGLRCEKAVRVKTEIVRVSRTICGRFARDRVDIAHHGDGAGIFQRDQAGKLRAALVDHPDHVVVGVRDIDVAQTVHRHRRRVIEDRRAGWASIATVGSVDIILDRGVAADEVGDQPRAHRRHRPCPGTGYGKAHCHRGTVIGVEEADLHRRGTSDGRWRAGPARQLRREGDGKCAGCSGREIVSDSTAHSGQRVLAIRRIDQDRVEPEVVAVGERDGLRRAVPDLRQRKDLVGDSERLRRGRDRSHPHRQQTERQRATCAHRRTGTTTASLAHAPALSLHPIQNCRKPDSVSHRRSPFHFARTVVPKKLREADGDRDLNDLARDDTQRGGQGCSGKCVRVHRIG